jgi:adenosylmethionine-8-amino-7-oxononanoate aminotransferase
MLVRPLVGGAIAVSPPLVIGDEEIAQIAQAFRTGLDAVANA